MGLSLHQHGHSHGGHSHGGHNHDKNNDEENGVDDDNPKGQGSKRNINVRAAFIHVLGDFIQSIGVFIAALIIYFKVSSNSDILPIHTFSHIFIVCIFIILAD